MMENSREFSHQHSLGEKCGNNVPPLLHPLQLFGPNGVSESSRPILLRSQSAALSQTMHLKYEWFLTICNFQL